MNQFVLKIVAPSGVVFNGQAWMITARDHSGHFSLQAHHAPLVTSLPESSVRVALTPDNRKTFNVKSGFLEFYDNTCVVVCEL